MPGNIHDNHKGRAVRALTTRHLRRAADFPGWDAPDYGSYLLPIPEGLTGTVTNVESHGAAPYTRYGVRFSDDSSASGLCPGTDIEFPG
jgi:hypothetical protein